jgi:pyruvate kinase
MADPAHLLEELEELISSVVAESARQSDKWMGWDIRPDFVPSVENLASYLALRHHDLRALQSSLMALGLSSLGRLESRVLPTLQAVRTALAAMLGRTFTLSDNEAEFFSGIEMLASRSLSLFGPHGQHRHTALMVTCPSEAADDPAFMLQMASHGVEALRINCAHDDADAWSRMIRHARTADAKAGRRFAIFMDLAGPKIRTGDVRELHGKKRLFAGDSIAITVPGGLDRLFEPEIGLAVECTLAEPIAAARPGHRVFIDDGTIAARIERADNGSLIAQVTRCKDKGAKLKSEKGINFPDSALAIPALTPKDRKDLEFVAAHADAINFSFVQSADDVALLQAALAELRPNDWEKLSLILKIETAHAVSNLPEIVVRAGARQPVGIMIARGDLAIEIGFTRLAEMQEEILWVGEAAQVPVIWATQVLEHFVKEGLPNRGELTDAAMAVRAECVMLNKGPYLIEAIEELDRLLARMDDHIHKKTPQLRRLRSW